MKKIVLILVLGLGVSGVFAQYDVEALLYTQKYYQSDARSVAIGNAFGAVGANFISSSINPAGLGFYRSSEFTISNGFYLSKTSSDYLSNEIEEHKFNYNVPSIGFVFSDVKTKYGKPVTEGWVSFTFAGGIVRTNNYHHRNIYSGLNTTSSIIDYYVESANKYNSNNWPAITNLAYEAYLFDPDTNNPGTYMPAYDTSLQSKQFYQTASLKTRGSAYDINFSFAGNYSDKVYVGASVSFPTINYHKTFDFEEENQNPDRNNYNSSSYHSELDVSGVGVQAGLGIIFRPVKFLRFGGSIKSPAFYSLSEEYIDLVSSNISTQETESQESRGVFDYRFTSPFVANAGIAVFLGKFGFISFDYEYQDHALAYFDSDNYTFLSENNNIENRYTGANIFRMGAEFRYEIFAIRGGYNIYQSPFNIGLVPSDVDGAATITSFGLGIRDKNYYFDAAYQLINSSSYTIPYSLTSLEVAGASQTINTTNIILTLGLKF